MAYAQDHLRSAATNTRRVCSFFQQGRCTRFDCPYAHTAAAAPVAAPAPQECWHFQNGGCHFGSRCLKLHVAAAAHPLNQQWGILEHYELILTNPHGWWDVVGIPEPSEPELRMELRNAFLALRETDASEEQLAQMLEEYWEETRSSENWSEEHASDYETVVIANAHLEADEQLLHEMEDELDIYSDED